MADHDVVIAVAMSLAIGAFAIVAALLEWRKERHLRAVGERTDGVVTRLRWSGSRAYPVIQFQTPDGRVLEVEGQLGSSPPMYRDGAAVRVLYDPKNPEHARIDRAAFGIGRIIFLMLFGLVFAAVGTWLLSGAW
ncbi:DUF3592 domain-containing protein [Solirubrobacter phytolaccae]|uniref:DUF3592 domain-containing protein n=1 Tax=Solirubrobacter phytolaccae TaxID=1404360 RepID=A0A9X3NDH2_9ACTN|nr:DUF3592 domain-containing protein [Solirubrobacter phytolaccae]MDA0183189.1 DUF3592 domain-containing protein [Solirubrobacter phytolaccae]